MTQNIPKYIKQLLYNHECIIVSGLGAFIAHNDSAIIDEKKNYFSPNKKSISFNSEIKKNDGLLANYIAEIENISYEEACVMLLAFTKSVLFKINNGNVFHFESIGSLQINLIGEIIFESDEKINFDPNFFGLESFYFPKINNQKKIIEPQYINGLAILFIFIAAGFFLSENMLLNHRNSNTASFSMKIKENKANDTREVSGLYKISVSQVDYDLYKILGTNYHLSTKRCFKMGEELEAHLKIYNNGKTINRNLCFLSELGLEFTDCYQIKKVYNQIPTSSNNLVVVDKKGRMRDAILVFEETEIDYATLTNGVKNKENKPEEKKNDITSRFLDAVKTLSENPDTIEDKDKNIDLLNNEIKKPSEKVVIQNETIDLLNNEITKTLEKVVIQNEPNEKKSKNKNVFVIVGCFSSEKNAKNLVSQLIKKGFKEACIAGKSSNRKLFQVACAKFETEKEARKKLKTLKKEFEGAWVLNRN